MSELVPARYYAIRHKPTGNFMPQSDRSIRAGFTHHEPRNPQAVPPRLFTREQDAKTALTWWLKGETSMRLVRFEDHWNGGHEYDEDWHTHPITDEDIANGCTPRRAEDMEVVPVEIRLA